jgi:HAD superfamily hydrolase (TIGR01549 family)
MSTPKAPSSGIDWSKIDGVIFDVDGTLFDHLAIRPAMAAALLRHVLTSRHGWRDLRVVLKFRRVRMHLALAAAGEIGRREFSDTAQATGVGVGEVRKIVSRWVYEMPLAVIPKYRFRGADEFITLVQQRGIRTGVFSDYPADGKLKALGLTVEVVRDATSTDVARLKPDPAGFLKVAELLAVSPARCLIIGDRDDRDGAAAASGGFVYLKKIAIGGQPQTHQFNDFLDLVGEMHELQIQQPATEASSQAKDAGRIAVP